MSSWNCACVNVSEEASALCAVPALRTRRLGVFGGGDRVKVEKAAALGPGHVAIEGVIFGGECRKEGN